MASTDCTMMLAQCLEIVREFARLNQCGSVSVRIGTDFDFSFSNQEIVSSRKLSPSQQNRNKIRRVKYQQSKMEGHHLAESRSENRQPEGSIKQELVTCFAQTDDICTIEDETQTEAVTLKDVAVNTEEEEILKLSDTLDISMNGAIEARNNEEKVIEMRISHNFKTWEDIQLYVKENLGMTLIGRPWLANSGNLFKTVGFRTLLKDYEAWKIRTFNWQESSVRAVSSSRLYR